MNARLEQWGDWLEERLGWRAAQELIEHKVVPRHRHTIWYYFGGMGIQT